MLPKYCKIRDIYIFARNLGSVSKAVQGYGGVIWGGKSAISGYDRSLSLVRDNVWSAIRRDFETRLAGYIAVTFLFLSFVWRPLSL